MKLFHSSGLESGDASKRLLAAKREPPREEELQSSFHRHFSPARGLWLSEEPARFAGDDTNLTPYSPERPATP